MTSPPDPPGNKRALVLLTLAFLLGAGPARADTPPHVEGVRVGLPAGKSAQESGRSRNGSWAPVYVALKAGAEGNPREAYRLAVETTDLEDTTYRYVVGVPALAPGEERLVLGYILPSGDGNEFAVKLESESGKLVQAVPRIPRDPSQEIVEPRDVLFLAAGEGLSQLKRTDEKLDQPGKDALAEDGGEKARRQVAYAESVSLLPDRWFGYDAVDVVVLGTAKKEFVEQLTQESESARRNALLEWVRRGGKLVLSVGRNHQAVKRLLEKMPVVDVEVTGNFEPKSPLTNLSNTWCQWPLHKAPLKVEEVAAVTPRGETHVLVREDSRPVLLQSSYGLGRVVLVAFDLDGGQFTNWPGHLTFWKRLQEELTPALARRGAANPARGWGDSGEPLDARSELKRGLETFEEVPVVPFGWVALFILFYIALVGPLDYFLLKKVFKRLELTWVTFPLTVLVVSVLAYVTAYSLKGDDLRVNKLDVVDVDLHHPHQVYGHTWFTLFSPRVQTYTVGVEPSPDWCAPPPRGAPGPLVSILDGSDRGLRTGSQGLFARPYEYAEEARGVRRVPIPVWATRSFSASWRAPLDPKAPPVDTRDEVGPIRASRTGDALVGRLTNNLPVELQGVTLLYRGKAYDLGTLAPGESRRVEALFAREARGQGRDLTPWLADRSSLAPGTPLAPTGRPLNKDFLASQSSYSLVKSLLFHEASGGSGYTNEGLRGLDQSWRLRPQPEVPIPERQRFRDEAVLVARTPLVSDRADEVTGHGASPARLWLGALPGEGERPAVRGFLTQETYLRVYIPVRSNGP